MTWPSKKASRQTPRAHASLIVRAVQCAMVMDVPPWQTSPARRGCAGPDHLDLFTQAASQTLIEEDACLSEILPTAGIRRPRTFNLCVVFPVSLLKSAKKTKLSSANARMIPTELAACRGFVHQSCGPPPAFMLREIFCVGRLVSVRAQTRFFGGI